MRGARSYNEFGIPTSCWLAIDAEGFVGMFDCGEAGAVPRSWPLGTLPGDFLLDRFPLDAIRVARMVANRRPIPSGAPRRIGRRVVAAIERGAAAATYRSGPRASDFEARLEPDRVVILREHAPRLIATLRALDSPLWNALARDPTITRWIDEDSLALWIDGSSDTGIYRWASLDPDAVGLYSRVDVPAEPIRIGDLPRRSQDELGVVLSTSRSRRARCCSWPTTSSAPTS